jgi:hypothetical protein
MVRRYKNGGMMQYSDKKMRMINEKLEQQKSIVLFGMQNEYCDYWLMVSIFAALSYPLNKECY